MGHPASEHAVFRTVTRIKEVFRNDGICGLGRKIRKKIGLFLYRTNCSIWFERDLDAPICGSLPEIEVGMEFLVQNKTPLIDWLQQNHQRFPWMYFEKEIESAIGNDHVFAVIFHQCKIIGYVKIGINRVFIHDFQQSIHFPAGSAFVYDTFILPEYRRKNLALFMLYQAMKYLRQQGFTRLLCHIEEWNKPSIKTFEKAGFIRKGVIRFSKMSGFSFFVRDGYAPMAALDSFLRKA